MPQLHAGTSGFAYPRWKPEFYPEKLAQAKFLGHYATRLNSVEINYTFRRHPSESTLEKWVKQTSEGFSFSVKANQRITHFQRLKGVQDSTEFFFKSIDPLRAAGRLGVVLFQLPPNLRCDVERLQNYLKLIPEGRRCAFEFRHESWFDEAVYEALREHNVCFCRAESDKLEAPPVLMADFVYFRLRKSDYSAEDRETIGAQASELLGEGKDVFLYFKHEDSPAGALYAQEMLAKIDR